MRVTTFSGVSARYRALGAVLVLSLAAGCQQRVLPSGPDFVQVDIEPATTAVGLPVAFAGSCGSAGTPVYRWTFGDGTTATGAVASHTYTTAATYPVQLTCTTADGRSAQSGFLPVVVAGPEFAPVLAQACSGREAGHGWCWQEPMPFGTIGMIAPASPLVVWAVGAGGMIKKSVDGGHQWVRQASPTSANLGALSVVNQSVAWAGGSDGASTGTVIRTVDGGAHWSEVTAIPGYVSAIAAISDQIAWGCSEQGVYLTRDSGRSWARQANDSPLVSCLSVSAPSATVAWASGRAAPIQDADSTLVVRTADGVAWKLAATRSQLPPVDLQRFNRTASDYDFLLAAPSASEAWMCGRSVGGVFHTVDGGLHWDQVAPRQLYVATLPTPSCHGIAVLDPVIPAANSGKTVAAYWPEFNAMFMQGGNVNMVGETADAGQTWILGGPPVVSRGAGRSGKVFAALTGTSLWATDGYDVVGSTTGPSGFWSNAQADTRAGLFALGAVNASVAFAIGISSIRGLDLQENMLRTTDGGAHWSVVSAGTVTATPCGAGTMAAGDVNNVWVIDCSGVMGTRDGGASWSTVPSLVRVNGTPSDIGVGHPFDPASPAVWVALGTGAPPTVQKLVRTNAASDSYGLQPQTWPVADNGVRRLSVVNATVAWGIGATLGAVARTTDGQTWMVLPAQRTQPVACINSTCDDPFQTISAVDENVAWVGSQRGNVYRTTDGGRSFAPVATLPDRPFGAGGAPVIAAADASTAWLSYGACIATCASVSDPNAAIWYTSDGGATWSAQGNFGESALAIQVAPNDAGPGLNRNIAWALVLHGILKTVTAGH